MINIPLALGIQGAALALVLFGRGCKASLIYVACLPFLWFVAITLISGHIVAAVHLLWLAPAIIAIWGITARRKRKNNPASSL